jgi:hypothetical protein
LAVTIFNLIEIALALLGVYVLFGLDEIRIAGKKVRGKAMAYVGMLLLTPLPFAVLIGTTSGAAKEIAKQAPVKTWEPVAADAPDESGWADLAGIAISASLIGLVFMVFGKPDDRTPDADNSLARDGWQDPPDWRRRAAHLSSQPLTVDQPKPAEQQTPEAVQSPANEGNYHPS